MEFRLLGPLEALSEGRPLPIGGQKQRRVLALLLLHANEVVSTDRLIDEVWGARPPKTVDASLQNCIYHLRSVVGREAIETRPPGYRLNVEADSVDSLRFEHALVSARALDPPERAAALREALALWRGPPLADVEFEGYAGSAVARLDELRLAALEERIDAELSLGRHDVVLGEIEALATRYPMRERLRRQQMLALYRAGRQRDALRVYQEARLELVEEFGLEPSDDLRALERMIIAHDPALSPTEAILEPPAHGLKRNAVVALLELVDREEAGAGAREVSAAALAEVAVIVERHEGELQQLLAEEVVAVFGSPVAHDDDALRALRAVEDVRAALPDRFAVRAAVERLAGATGVDDVRGLLAQAAAGDLLLGREALRVIPAAVDVVPHESGAGYRVLHFDPGAESFVRHLDAPIVGRVAELERLGTVLAEVERSGSVARVVLIGEPGIGKTRLANAFVSQLGGGSRTVAGRCRAYGDGAGLRPLRDMLEQLEPLEDVLAGQPDAGRILGPLRQEFARPSEGFWAFRRLLESATGDGPLVVLLEDLHWAAPELLDLVEYLLGWTAGPVLLVCVARPELLESPARVARRRARARPDLGRRGAVPRRDLARATGPARERGQCGRRRGRREPALPGATRRLRGRRRARCAAPDTRGLDHVPDRPCSGRRTSRARAGGGRRPAFLAVDRRGRVTRRRAGRGRRGTHFARAPPARARGAHDVAGRGRLPVSPRVDPRCGLRRHPRARTGRAARVGRARARRAQPWSATKPSAITSSTRRRSVRRTASLLLRCDGRGADGSVPRGSAP